MANGVIDRAPSTRRAFAIYNLLRLGLLAACFGLGWLATLRGIPLVVAALLVSGILSWFLLRKQREAMGVAVEAQVQRGRALLAERTAKEDAYADSITPADPPAAQ